MRHGHFACSYGQTASGAVAIQALAVSTVARRFRAVRRERAPTPSMWTTSRPRGKGPATGARAIHRPTRRGLGPAGTDGTHLQDLSLALRRELWKASSTWARCAAAPSATMWNKTAPGEIGSDGHKAIAALLANALLPSEHQGNVLRSVSHWLQRMGMAEQISVRALGRSGRYELLVHHDGVVANLRDVGVGVSQVLPVLAVAYCARQAGTVLLEEPKSTCTRWPRPCWPSCFCRGGPAAPGAVFGGDAFRAPVSPHADLDRPAPDQHRAVPHAVRRTARRRCRAGPAGRGRVWRRAQLAPRFWRRDGRGTRTSPGPCPAHEGRRQWLWAGAMQVRLVDTNVHRRQRGRRGLALCRTPPRGRSRAAPAVFDWLEAFEADSHATPCSTWTGMSAANTATSSPTRTTAGWP